MVKIQQILPWGLGCERGCMKRGCKRGGSVPEYWFWPYITCYEALVPIFEVKFVFFHIVTRSFQIYTPAPPFFEIFIFQIYVTSGFTRIKNQVYTMIPRWNMLPRALKTTFLQEKLKNHQKIISHSVRKSLIFLHYHWIFEMTHSLIWAWYEVHFWCKLKLRWHILWFEAFWKRGGHVPIRTCFHTHKIQKNHEFKQFHHHEGFD